MCNHVGAQIAPPSSQDSVKDAQRKDHDDLFPALVSMREPEDRSLQHNSERQAAGRAKKLLL